MLISCSCHREEIIVLITNVTLECPFKLLISCKKEVYTWVV